MEDSPEISAVKGAQAGRTDEKAVVEESASVVHEPSTEKTPLLKARPGFTIIYIVYYIIFTTCAIL